jgi:phytoene dehydrogenase-like protein
LELGGSVFYRNKVEKILEDNGKAVGIRLSDQNEIRGNYVISSADLHSTLYGMLEGKHIDPMHGELFQNCKVFPAALQVSFGLNNRTDMKSDSVLGESFNLKKPVKIGNQYFNSISFKNYSFDPTLTPAGKTVIKSMFMIDDFQYWANLVADKKAYHAEKERIAVTIADELDGRYPGFKSSIEFVDVATPTTYVRYTGNWKGAFMTWVIPPNQAKRFRVVKKTVPGLDNFWLCGVWIQPPGGTPAAAMSARHVIQLICNKDKTKFQTSTAAIS